jgi:hypothetical protein
LVGTDTHTPGVYTFDVGLAYLILPNVTSSRFPGRAADPKLTELLFLSFLYFYRRTQMRQNHISPDSSFRPLQAYGAHPP